MERREQFLNIVSTLASSEEIAAKYADHLEELFDVIIPEKIGDDFCEAIASNDYEAAVKACATYYREKSDNPVSELSGKGSYSVKDAEIGRAHV